MLSYQNFLDGEDSWGRYVQMCRLDLDWRRILHVRAQEQVSAALSFDRSSTFNGSTLWRAANSSSSAKIKLGQGTCNGRQRHDTRQLG